MVVLGSTGRNFAAGMSGGIAYIFDEAADFASKCNKEMVALLPIEEDEDVQFLKARIGKHFEVTGSDKAQMILDPW